MKVLTSTKSPTVISPFITRRADMSPMAIMPLQKITPWPKLRNPREDQMRMADRS